MDIEPLRQRLARHGQEHVLAYWDELTAAGRAQLAGQLAGIDLDLIESLARDDVQQTDWHALARRAEPPPTLRVADRERDAAASWGANSTHAQRRGEEALAQGRVGVLLVAGGQGSRLGFDKPKGLYPIGPVSRASLLQIHIEKTLAAARTYGCPIPLYLMTSPVTHDETLEFLDQHHGFGLPAEDLIVFCQGTMPAVDASTGKLLLAAKDSLFLSPDGHGGTVAALAKNGVTDDMRRRGIEQLFYLQVDNPLAPICDEQFLGHHLLADSELTSVAVAKQDPQDKLGNFVLIDGKLHVIEYSDFPADTAGERDSEGNLRFWAGSVAIHLFDAALLERAATLSETLPFHVARKKAEVLGRDGSLVVPDQPNALKFERFIFDLLPHARRPIVIEYREEEAFAPLKNAAGAPKDTPEYVRRFMLNQHRRWLEAAGAELDPQAEIEISPLFARDATDVKRRIRRGKKFHGAHYLAPSSGEETER